MLGAGMVRGSAAAVLRGRGRLRSRGFRVTGLRAQGEEGMITSQAEFRSPKLTCRGPHPNTSECDWGAGLLGERGGLPPGDP